MPIELEDRGKALESEYFRRKEHELIAKMKEKLAEQNTKSLDLACPKCDGTLYEADYEGVKIDVCNKCSGVWFDAGELAQAADRDKTGWFGKIFG